MTIRYPNGKIYHDKGAVKTTKTSTTLYGNRGMSLEEDLQETNVYYLHQDIAVVHKNLLPSKLLMYITLSEVLL